MGKIAVKAEDQGNSSAATHTMLEKSSTLNRHYVKRPKAVAKKPAPVAKTSAKPASRRALLARKSASIKASKESAAKSASRSVSHMNNNTPKMKTKRKPHRIAFAIACSAVTVLGLFFFVQTSMPDITVKVTAMQTGIDAVYPSYIPRNYSFKDATSEKDGSITMTFSGPEGASFTLTEEKSTWDSNALLNNFVKSNFSGDYATLRERGITVYVDRGSAAWVNGGILFKTTSSGKNLTKEQIINLVSSL